MIGRSVALALAALSLLRPPVSAQGRSPAGDLTIMAPAAPGGGWDQTARVMQHVLRETGLASSVQVINAPGAAGTIGLARFVRSETGNPRSLLVTGLVMLSGVAVNRSPVTLADVIPIARLSGEYEVVVVPAVSPITSLSELVAAFQRNPRSVSWGGGSAGGTDEILVRLLAQRAGVDGRGVNYIAYSGGGQALAAVLGGHVTAAVSGLGEFAPQIESGALRALAISAPARHGGSSIPTFAEQGIDLVLLNWRGVAAPPGLSRAERGELTKLVQRMASSAPWRAALARNGWDDIYLDGVALDRYLADETARVSAVVDASRSAPRGSSPYELLVLAGAIVALVLALVTRAPADHQRLPIARRPLLTFALALVLNVALIEPLGFVAATAATFLLAARAFGSRRLARDLAIGIAFAATVYLAFTRGLGVDLPAGPIG